MVRLVEFVLYMHRHSLPSGEKLTECESLEAVYFDTDVHV